MMAVSIRILLVLGPKKDEPKTPFPKTQFCVLSSVIQQKTFCSVNREKVRKAEELQLRVMRERKSKSLMPKGVFRYARKVLMKCKTEKKSRKQIINSLITNIANFPQIIKEP